MIDAREQLRQWMVRSKLTQRAAAKLLGMHYTFLSQILRRERAPALATAVKIYRLTGVPVDAWLPTDDGSQLKVPAKAARKRKAGRRALPRETAA